MQRCNEGHQLLLFLCLRIIGHMGSYFGVKTCLNRISCRFQQYLSHIEAGYQHIVHIIQQLTTCFTGRWFWLISHITTHTLDGT